MYQLFYKWSKFSTSSEKAKSDILATAGEVATNPFLPWLFNENCACEQISERTVQENYSQRG